MLDDFLEAAALRPFADGSTDCAMTAADWVLAVTGCDPAADLRGHYRTALGRERLLRRLGGLEAAMASRLADLGLSETANPVREDVGIIRLPNDIVGAGICLGRLWWMASSVGHLACRPVVLRAWRVNA